MRQFGVVLIVAASVLNLNGCKTDRASKESSTVDSRTSDLPKIDTSSAKPPATLELINKSQDKRPLVVCFGDSLTAGYGTEAGQTYPDYLQAELDSSGYQYRVVNAGISGNTTKDGLERVNNIIAINLLSLLWSSAAMMASADYASKTLAPISTRYCNPLSRVERR